MPFGVFFLGRRTRRFTYELHNVSIYIHFLDISSSPGSVSTDDDYTGEM